MSTVKKSREDAWGLGAEEPGTGGAPSWRVSVPDGEALGESSLPRGRCRPLAARTGCARTPPSSCSRDRPDDEVCELGAERRPTKATLSAPPAPGRFAVAAQQGLGRDEERPSARAGEQATERGEDRPICRPVAKMPVQPTLEDADLMAEHQELEGVVRRQPLP